MDKEQHMYLKLSEECMEVAHIVSKIIQFGINEKHPNLSLNNRERLYQELDDLSAVVEILNERYNLGFSPSDYAIQGKKAKIEKYLSYSINLGRVNG